MSVFKVVLGMAILWSVQSVYGAPVENFGTDITALQAAFAQKNVHILQVGDSHTAGDYFTEQLRKRLQAQMGDGGLGFAYAGKLKNQRTARHDYNNGWQMLSSKNDSFDEFPLGGVVAVSNGGTQVLTSQYYANDTQNAYIRVKGIAGQTITISNAQGTQTIALVQNGWQTLSTKVVFPTYFNADNGVALGGFWLYKQGGRVSAMGINGATQSYWQRWQSIIADLQTGAPNLVILAYGTNEAFADNNSSQESAIQFAINTIKYALPKTPILLVSAPESLKSTAGTCGVRASNLDNAQNTIRRLAQQNHTLYWDWQAAMGGVCTMKSWINQGLAAKDGVHFTRSGYEYAANDLYDNLELLLFGFKPDTISGDTPTNLDDVIQDGSHRRIIICQNGQCTSR